ncbi:MAG: Asp-tRNA(Asn)/Glu-tRNA(Gln) amidotransferase GatCAB subunit B [Acidimicrobiaceae bacterium]|nr:Asp-tRNA(Asn)/Glu-tRNA(Gln) amidotransferase GatCAB subunit B [Acidimicrobiaceae bacterium]
MSKVTFKDNWELIVGLEVHAELATRTKLFCGCLNEFGNEPNTNVCPVCLGLPGSLPVVNEQAVYFAMRLGEAVNCSVNRSVFARKNYFYPDMPKDYQISQYDLPTNTNGYLDLPEGKRIGIERAHIEEDTGKTTHKGESGRISGADYSLVDYNRAGVPLIEIVSQPDIRTVDQAKSYVSELRQILLALEVSDAKMEEGSIRVDANVSVRPIDESDLRTRCEIKNVNSLRSLGRAIEYEANRHINLYDNGESPTQETRHWDEISGRTRPGRSKEDAEDYRYFPEPDLVPLNPSAAELKLIKDGLPNLPAQRRKNLMDILGSDANDAVILVEREHDAFAVDAIELGGVKESIAKYLINNLADGMGDLSPKALAELTQMEANGDVTSTQARKILVELVANGGAPGEIAEHLGLETIDADAIEKMVLELIGEHPNEWGRYRDGDKKVQGFFVGQIMKATSGQADGKIINQILSEHAKAQ